MASFYVKKKGGGGLCVILCHAHLGMKKHQNKMFKVVLKHSRQPSWLYNALTRDDKWSSTEIKRYSVLPE